MLLKRMLVTNFRSVSDSGWVDIDHVTALVGVNESGKSNMLIPLWKFNPAQEGEIHPTSDYPKRLFGDIRQAPGKYRFITVEFDTGPLAHEIARLSGAAVEDARTVRVGRSFDGSYDYAFPEEKSLSSIAATEVREILVRGMKSVEAIKAQKQEEDYKEAALSCIEEQLAGMAGDVLDRASVQEVHRALAATVPPSRPARGAVAPAFDQIVEEIATVLASLSRPPIADHPEVRELVKAALPTFVYYSNYGNLDSEIYLPHVVQNLERADLGTKEAAKARTLRVLFKFVQLEPKEILALGKEESPQNGRPTDEQIEAASEKKRERSILLQSAGSKLTERFRNWWKQGDYRFRFEADGSHFRIWVADDRRPDEVELESRSTGLQWFLSFYLVFLVESEEAHRKSILLLDEPGLSLHPLAQKDLSAFFENLATTNQLIFTTHSPFLVDADRLDRARKVYVSDDGTTKVSDNLRDSSKKDEQKGAAYAVHSALNMSIAESLLIGCQPVLVEGATDQHYLTAIKSVLIREGRIHPKRELVFPPSGGAKPAKMIAAILTGRDDELPFVLLDGDKVGKSAMRDLRDDLYQGRPERVLDVSAYSGIEDGEIEDLIPRDIMVQAIDRLFRASEVDDEFVNFAGPGAIVPQIRNWAAKVGVALPKDYKVQLAKRVKQTLLSTKASDIGDETIAVWVKTFDAFAV